MPDPLTPPRIYSYVRFSSQRQLKGDSLKRQNALIDRYTREKGYELDNEFRYVHIGPAYRGQNVQGGKLRLFLEAIREGKVPVGSVLLIESLDRLTRMQPMEAYSVFLEIINGGVKIITLSDGYEHSKDGPDGTQLQKLLISAVNICRAHEESHLKSTRLKSKWADKRTGIKKVPYTSRIPRWLAISPDKITITAVPEKAETVRRMFKLCIEGQSVEGIAKKFREENVPLVAGGKNWTHSYVSQTLRNPAVTGQFTPNRMENGKRVPASIPILDYYPKIIEQKDFDRVQFIMDSRSRNKGGRVGEPGENLFRKKLFCGYCGSPIHVNYKGKYYKGGNRKLLLCRNAKDHTGCFGVSWDYWEFEEAFIRAATELQFEIRNRFSGNELRDEIQDLSGRVNRLQNQLDRLQKSIEEDDSGEILPKTILKRMREIESELNEEKVRKNQAERKLSAGLEGPLSMKQLTTLVEKVKDPNIRIIIADLISQIFERIDVFPAGTKFNFARLKRMHKVQVRKWGRDDGHVKAYLRDNFDRRKVRFFQAVLNLPGLNQRLCFSNNGSMIMEARLDLAQDLPEDADFGDDSAK